jgi:hypothetical protein
VGQPHQYLLQLVLLQILAAVPLQLLLAVVAALLAAASEIQQLLLVEAATEVEVEVRVQVVVPQLLHLLAAALPLLVAAVKPSSQAMAAVKL